MDFLMKVKLLENTPNQLSTGPNLDLSYICQSDAGRFCENYARLYFDAKHLEKGLDRVW